MRLIVFSLFTWFFLLSTSLPVIANDTALTASPAILEAVLNFDHPTQTTIYLQNNTNFPLPIKGSVSAFLATEVIPDPAKDRYDASRWFSLDPPDFILQPSERKEIKVTITPPPDAEPGGHYATIFFRPLIPQDIVSSSHATSLGRIGVLALTLVPGDIVESLQSNSLQAPTFQTFGPIKYEHSLTNTGSTHLLPITTLAITNFFGKTVYTKTLDASLILPKTTKDNSLTWETRWGFGPYHARLETNYGTDHPVLTSNTTTTWLLPWPLLLPLIFILLLATRLSPVRLDRIRLAYLVLLGRQNPDEILLIKKSPILTQSKQVKRRKSTK